MCGIVGVVDYEGRYRTPELQRLTTAMRDALAHRGPDDAGLWTSADGRVCLGHRRLAIIDPRPEGRQPMLDEAGRVALTFNGEIYNFRPLRAELERAGHRFNSRTDSEVLCHLLEGDPETAVERLNGMFAFGAWRTPQRELVLARDPFGKKPLYYLRDGAFMAFASELRPLEMLGLGGGIDPVAVQEYLLLQYVHAPRTIYRNVCKLRPGTVLTFRFGAAGECAERSHRYFRFEAREPVAPGSCPGLAEELRGLLVHAVADRLVADVPVGAFLSGGNDSSLVVAVMARELGVRPKTFSVGFTGSAASEHLAARQIAEHLGADHHELLVAPSAVDMLPEVVAALDEPNGDSSCLPVYLLSRFARGAVTVALSGDGGDEMFGGYDRYTETICESASLRRRLSFLRRTGRWWSAGRAYFGDRILPMTEPVLRDLAGKLEPEAEDLMTRLRSVADGRGPALHRLRTVDANSYLPGAVLAKVDRMSMRFALEIRCPLLDRRVAEWASSLPASALNDGTEAKKVLKSLALRYLPREIVYRPKRGFGLPDPCWSQQRLLDLADDLLLGTGARISGHLDARRLREHLARQRRPRKFNVYQVWELLVLEQWLRQAGSVPVAAVPPSPYPLPPSEGGEGRVRGVAA
jgi:asparagine synthase (glutamine-hydrolysing)